VSGPDADPGTRAERPATAPLAAERDKSTQDHASRARPTAASTPSKVVLVLEFDLDPDADPDAVERVVRDYVRWIQTTAHDTSELARARVHAAIGRDARRVLEVVDR
jgi:hypothetical protein